MPVVGWDETIVHSEQFLFSGRIATSVTHVDDNQLVAAQLVIDKIGITSGRKYTNSRDVSFPSEARISG
jgi:hypothetical protein